MHVSRCKKKKNPVSLQSKHGLAYSLDERERSGLSLQSICGGKGEENAMKRDKKEVRS